MTKHTYFIPLEKIQGFKTSQSYFMMRQKAQHVTIVVRDSDSAQYLTLRYLKLSEGHRIESCLTRVK